jgi:hypothetical protein
LPGMLLHIDGSHHQWFQDERWYDLIVILDDATSEIYYAQLTEEESTLTVMAGLKEVIERKGVFCALYSDRGGHFWLTPKAGGKIDPHRLTQVGRALRELGVQMIPAYSPQARGRSERNFSTWQGREVTPKIVRVCERDHRRTPCRFSSKKEKSRPFHSAEWKSPEEMRAEIIRQQDHGEHSLPKTQVQELNRKEPGRAPHSERERVLLDLF